MTGEVLVAVPGWNRDQCEALDFLLRDGGIEATWARENVVSVPAVTEQQVLALVAFVGSNHSETQTQDSPQGSDGVAATEPDLWTAGDAETARAPAWAAKPGLRLAGYLVDAFVLCLAGIPIAFLFSGRTRYAIALAMSAIYAIVLIGWRGQTVGNLAVRTRVVSLRTGRVPSPVAAAVRWTVFNGVAVAALFVPLAVLAYPFWLLGMSVPILCTRFRQGLHDLAADVVVVDERDPSGAEQVAQVAVERAVGQSVAR
jgi:uncharacterized RDD family membrane protein YckC